MQDLADFKILFPHSHKSKRGSGLLRARIPATALRSPAQIQDNQQHGDSDDDYDGQSARGGRVTGAWSQSQHGGGSDVLIGTVEERGRDRDLPARP
jgi:hypothetical protein